MNLAKSQSNNIAPVTSFNNKNVSNATSALPTTYTTAQNCLSNFLTQEQIQTTATTLMIKNFENTTPKHTDCDEKIEEKEISIVLQRRNSVPEDATTTATNAATKLNIIKERHEVNNSNTENILLTTTTTTTAETATTSQDAATTTAAAATTIAAADTTTASVITHEDSVKSAHINTADNNLALTTDNTTTTTTDGHTRTPSPTVSLRRRSSSNLKEKPTKPPSQSKIGASTAAASSATGVNQTDEDTVSKTSDTGVDLVRSNSIHSTQQQQADSTNSNVAVEKPKSASRLSERAKKKSWYNVLYPNYKSRSQDFKKLFKSVPNDERLIVDYSCALQRDILLQGRLYVSQNYVCFHANIFGWETYVTIEWQDVILISKEKTARVIPNAISISTEKENYFFATFTARDKAYLMLFRIWQNRLMNKQLLPHEIWQFVHNCYGDELGLTTDDEDYIDPTTVLAHDSETDLDFVSAIDDTQSLSQIAGTVEENSAAVQATNSNTSINQDKTNTNTKNISGNSSTSSGSGGVRKSKSRSYFFGSKKSTSTTASASGSDNKASDNNSGIDSSKLSKNAKMNVFIDTANETVSASTAQLKDSDEELSKVPTAASAAVAAAVTTTTHENKRKVSKNSRQRDESLSKNSEATPTDLSDSSDSVQNKIPFVATAECTSPHEGRQLVHTILPINIETLFNLLFSKSKFMVEFHVARKTTDTNFGEWQTSAEGQKSRIVNLTVQLAASVGPKSSKVTEYQVMRDCSKSNELYSIDVNSVNAGIPYADSFSVTLHYCLVRTIDDNTMLSVHGQIKYKKSIWGVVKGFIEKNTWAGLEDFFTALLHALQNETCIPPAKGKGRRPRRGTATQIRPIEEAPPIAQNKPKLESSDIAHHIHTLTPHTLPAASKVACVLAPPPQYKWLSLFVIMLLCFLLALNVILLLKLWKLEDRIEDDINQRARMPNLEALKQIPHSDQEWIELLRQQEVLHETELKKWHKVLQTAIELLKKTEKTLAELMFR